MPPEGVSREMHLWAGRRVAAVGPDCVPRARAGLRGGRGSRLRCFNPLPLAAASGLHQRPLFCLSPLPNLRHIDGFPEENNF